MVLTFRDVSQLNFNLGESQHVLGCGPRADELIDQGLAAVRRAQAEAARHQVAEAFPVLLGLRGLGGAVLRGAAAVVGEVRHIHVASVETSHLTAHCK